MQRFLHVGGLVAVGFDQSGDYLLTISHSGRGVFSTQTWEKLVRDSELAYPENGTGIGIVPINGETIPITEIDYDTGILQAISRNGQFVLNSQEGAVEIIDSISVRD